MSEFDVVIIGGGPGGYICAIKCAQFGLNVAVVEKRATLGGTCLNVGCIPSKALLHSSHMYEQTINHLEHHGVLIEGVIKHDIQRMMERKSTVVSDLAKGIDGLFAKNKITRFTGVGSVKSNSEVVVNSEQGEEVINAKNIIIATGSTVATLPNISIDESVIVSSTGALQLTKTPRTMAVIGGGYIGLEMGSVWSRLGTKVTVIEYSDRLLPAMDGDISKEALKIFKGQGMEVMLNTKVLSAVNNGENATVAFEQDGNESSADFDIVLVAVGRKPYTENLGLENVGVTPSERGTIPVDNHFKTSADGVYAIGDVVEGPMLAHKAEEEGVALANILVGKHGHINYNNIPGVVYTHPEIASVGYTEEELKSSGKEYKTGKFPFLANSRARTTGETLGFVKVLTDAKTDEILGAHIIGDNAGDLIAELVLGREYKAASEDISLASHSHPGLSEAVKEACLAAHFKPLHL